jgi:hypothetical protein
MAYQTIGKGGVVYEQILLPNQLDHLHGNFEFIPGHLLACPNRGANRRLGKRMEMTIRWPRERAKLFSTPGIRPTFFNEFRVPRDKGH